MKVFNMVQNAFLLGQGIIEASYLAAHFIVSHVDSLAELRRFVQLQGMLSQANLTFLDRLLQMFKLIFQQLRPLFLSG